MPKAYEQPPQRTALQFAEYERTRGTRLVSLGTEAAVRPCPEDGRSAIGAYGLDGNIAIVVLLEIPDRPLSRVALIGHYSPHHLLMPAQRFRILIQSHLVKGMQATALLVAPGKWVNNDSRASNDDESPERLAIVPVRQRLAEQWHTCLRMALPDLRRVAQRLYHPARHPDIPDHGTVKVEFPRGTRRSLHVVIEGLPV